MIRLLFNARFILLLLLLNFDNLVVAESQPKPKPKQHCQKLMVPAYSYPSSAPDSIHYWNTMTYNMKGSIFIMNPNSGPSTIVNSDYVTAVNNATLYGIHIIGYVATTYGAKSLIDVKAEIDLYFNQYTNISGIFLDETASSIIDVSYYQNI